MADESNFCLHIVKEDGYFHAICQGEITLSRVLAGWAKLAERCSDEKVYGVVCQPHAPGPGAFLDVYQFSMSFRDIAWPPGMRIAVVCGKGDLPRYQLAELMVSNLRGPESRIFATLPDARSWLLARPPATAP